jgi:hypothetical protein
MTVRCAHCRGRVFETRIADETSYTGPAGTWTHVGRAAEADSWCETPEPGEREP